MTYVLVDGFDNYAALAAGFNAVNPAATDIMAMGKWSSMYVFGCDQNIMDGGLGGGRFFRINGFSSNGGGAGLLKTIVGGTTEVVVGGWVRYTAISTGANCPMWTFDYQNGNYHIWAKLNLTTFKLEYRRGFDGAIVGTGSYVFQDNEWVHVEIYVKIDATVGRIVTKITPLSTMVTTTDTDYTGNTKHWHPSINVCDMVEFAEGSGGMGGNKDLDHCVIRAGESTFLGPLRVRTMRPIGAGTYTGLTPTPGNLNYINVNDMPHDNDLTYLTGAAAAKDLYVFPDLPSTLIPLAVQLHIVARKDDGAARSIAPLVKTGADSQGATQVLSAVSHGYYQVYPTDPNDASAWTKAKVDAAEFGVVVVA